MFQIGDLVCYPMHGVGVVEAIEEQTILGKTAQYYRLRFTIGRITAMVPFDKSEQVGLRALADVKTCEEVVEVESTEQVNVKTVNELTSAILHPFTL